MRFRQNFHLCWLVDAAHWSSRSYSNDFGYGRLACYLHFYRTSDNLPNSFVYKLEDKAFHRVDCHQQGLNFVLTTLNESCSLYSMVGLCLSFR